MLLLDRLLIKSIFAISPATALHVYFSALTLTAPDNSTRRFNDCTAPTRYSHPSRSVLTDRHTIFNFLKAFAVYSLLSTLLGLMGEPCAHCSHVCEYVHTLAFLVAVAPL